MVSPSDISITTMTQDAYLWPGSDLKKSLLWKPLSAQQAHVMEMPENLKDLALDSRWPAFFPSPISLVTAGDGKRVTLERVVGASIVNRFPYVMALSFCKQAISRRHYPRTSFMEILESGGCAAIQYLEPGPELSRVMEVIHDIPDERSQARLNATGLKTRPAQTNGSPVFSEAYMVYEVQLVKPGKDFEGQPIYQTPWIDVGSHRVYFLEITAIQLRQDIAYGPKQIYWRSLPAWEPKSRIQTQAVFENPALAHRYTKAYTPHYVFPSSGTIAYQADTLIDGMAVKYLPPLAADQLEVDNDRARWPCFFPSSAALITTWVEDGCPNFMPCGSTTVLSRHPMVIAPCVSYSNINQRYAPRATLSSIRKSNRFGCAVPYIHDAIINAMRYAGNISFALDREKVANSGLEVSSYEGAPLLPALPIHYDCEVIGEVPLGTHVMFLGKVRSIRVRDDVSPDNPIRWYPWAEIDAASVVSSAVSNR
jgi:flavin reductase (DIM6/NTAB) family NADH-FMN oxidoreductase RutF